MLNNCQLTAETLEVMVREYGTFDPDEDMDEHEITDTRDTLAGFRAGANELKGYWKEYRGVRYFAGTIQLRKGDTRQTFLLIPQGEWNIVAIG